MPPAALFGPQWYVFFNLFSCQHFRFRIFHIKLQISDFSWKRRSSDNTRFNFLPVNNQLELSRGHSAPGLPPFMWNINSLQSPLHLLPGVSEDIITLGLCSRRLIIRGRKMAGWEVTEGNVLLSQFPDYHSQEMHIYKILENYHPPFNPHLPPWRTCLLL